MAIERYGEVVRQVGRLWNGGAVAASGEDRLLERFAFEGDPSAFEGLVARHGPMVLGTCRRLLGDGHDVEDAFQATFLVLARRAGTIRDADRLGPWLHGVALKVARRSRAQSARRRAVEAAGGEGRGGVTSLDGSTAPEALELRAALDEELARLPEKYRAPLVLCYLEGLTHDEAAGRLHWPVGTVRSRLAGGRDRLRGRLARRGLSPASAALLPGGLPGLHPPVPLLTTTVRLASMTGTPSATVASLAKGAMIAMSLSKLKLIAACGILGTLATAGAGGAVAQSGGSGTGTAAAPAQPAATTTPEPAPKALEAANERIKALEAELAALRGEARIVSRATVTRTGVPAAPAAPAPPIPPSPMEPGIPVAAAPAAPAPPPVQAPGGGMGRGAMASPRPRTTPNVMSLGGVNVMIISPGLDRVTILNTETGTRETYHPPRGLAEIMPVSGSSGLGLWIQGDEIKQVAAFDYRSGKWNPYDLREPAKGRATPTIGDGVVTYQIGKLRYTFNNRVDRWSVLETNEESPRELPGPQGKTILQDGDQIHIYNVKTGDWTHHDIKDEK